MNSIAIFYAQADEGSRTDLVQEYTRSFKGRLVLSGGASVSGAALGAIISKVILLLTFAKY